MGYLPNHHLYGKIPGLYQQSQYLFIQMISVFISTKKYSLVQIFCSALSRVVVQLLMYCHTLFFFSVLVSALHNSLGLARTFLECSRNFLFVGWLVFLRFQFSHAYMPLGRGNVIKVPFIIFYL